MTPDTTVPTELVAAAQRGERRAVERIVQENAPWIRSVIYGMTGRRDLVDDVAQQVWISVWRRIADLQDPGRLRSWLYSIARNAAIDALDAERRRPRALPVEERQPAADDQGGKGPVSVLESREVGAALQRAIESLPAIYREPFVLRHLENWSYAEIGAALGLIEDTVETRLVRARRLLREALEGRV